MKLIMNNGSFIKLGCTAEWADNYDQHKATEDDGFYIRTFTAVWADNYDEFATIDDGSCFKNGCLEYNDCNYDSLATLDDGSCIKSKYDKVICLILYPAVTIKKMCFYQRPERL